MTKFQMLNILRHHLSDEQKIGWPSDIELNAFLDRAAETVSERLASDRDPSLVASLTVSGPTSLPDDFLAFVGKVPVTILDRVASPYEGATVTADYWRMLPRPSAFQDADEVPCTTEQAGLIIDLARIYALNKNEYDISQDLALLGQTTKSIAAVRGR